MKGLISFLLRNVPRKYLQLFSHQVLSVVALFNKGNDVECPVCGKTYSKFLPYGRINPRKNALCPHCLSLERHRLLWLYLKNETDFFSAKLRLLHIAPERCFMTRFEKLENLDYITGDIESPLAKVKMDIHQIPFEDNDFDVVFCNHVMEHVDNDLQAMVEIHRVLKPGGWAIIQIPLFDPVPETTYEDRNITDPKEREKAFGQDDHVRLYGKDYQDRLATVGFEVEVNKYLESFDAGLAHRYGLPTVEDIYVCRK